MNKAESLALYAKGKDAWNAWAAEWQTKREELMAASKWVKSGHPGGWNDETVAWDKAATADFSGRTFEDYADFSGFVFPGRARFDEARFKDVAKFDDASFEDQVMFIRTTFESAARFDKAAFKGYARFDKPTFRGYARFGGATFKGTAWFGEAAFKRTALFDKATFEDEARFDEARFEEVAKFDEATFEGVAKFGGATFEGVAWLEQTLFKGFTTFQNAKFLKAANFGATQGESAFSLTGASFREVPNFEQAHFEEAPRLDNLRIEPASFPFFPNANSGVTAEDVSDLAARWRALKRLAIQGHDHARELEFFRGELKARRWGEDKAWHAVFWFGVFYETFSDFGRSLLRPLLCWFASIILFTCFYIGQQLELAKHALSGAGWAIAQVFSFAGAKSPSLSCVAGSGEPWLAALGLSLRNGLLFLGGSGSDKLKQTYGCLYGIYSGKGIESDVSAGRFLPNIPDSVAFLGLLQLLISSALIFLFLLAVRNHFRIK